MNANQTYRRLVVGLHLLKVSSRGITFSVIASSCYDKTIASQSPSRDVFIVIDKTMTGEQLTVSCGFSHATTRPISPLIRLQK